MACVMPGAPDLEAFWANILDGVDSVTEVSPARWVTDLHFDPDFDTARPDAGKNAKSVSKWGGFVPGVGFDALRWGIPPASLASIDPAQLFALKVADAALVDAGYGTGEGLRELDRDMASVVYATGSGGAADLQAGVMTRMILRTHSSDPLPPDIDAFLPELTEDGLPGALTSLISGRVANRLDFGGKNLTVDSACASVLVALEIACDELNMGRSDLSLCGGVDLHNGAGDYVSFTAAHALSPTGRCRSFDASADGMTLAEGCGCIVLKRLEDAERDGDRIYAVIKGVAGSSDGRHLGLTAPRQEGQEKAVRRAYAAAGISPADVGLVEAHGTGTVVGDRTELGTITTVFGEAGAARGSIVLGSVKSNIGHIKCASGIASLIKSAKAAYHGVQPPTLHIREPNEGWDPATSPFVFLDQARPWLEDRRLVGVSAFGFGGTNFHAILENHTPDPAPDARAAAAAPAASAAGGSGGDTRPARVTSPPTGRPQWPAELFGFRAADDTALRTRLDELADRLAGELTEPRQADRWRLRDIAASVCAAGDGPVRLALVARDLDDLAAKVDAARTGRPDPGVVRATGAAAAVAATSAPPPVAFLLPGPESARPGMLADLLVAFPPLREAAVAGRRWTAAMLPPQAFGQERERQRAALAETAEPAVAVANLTMAGVLAVVGVRPSTVVRADDEAGLEARVRELHAAGTTVFVEAGPGDALTGRVRRALGEAPHLAVATDHPGRHGLTSLLEALAELAVAGVPVDLAALHTGRGSDPRRWEEPGRAPGWIVNGHYVRTARGDCLPKGLRHAHEAPMMRLGSAAAGLPGEAPAPSNGDGAGNGNGAGHARDPGGAAVPAEVAVVMEYLRLVQGVVATGSEIIQSQLAGQLAEQLTQQLAPVPSPGADRTDSGSGRAASESVREG
jgi:acyl transferase domain-containing protein